MRPDDVLDFWFEGNQPREQWFVKDPAFDDEITRRFGGTIEAALADMLDVSWHETPRGTLARIIVLDQFTRNAFRGTPRAFAGDALALSAAGSMVARGDDQRLAPLQRTFVYLPFEHAEDRASQHEALRLFEQLGRDDPSLADQLEWARKHAAVIERFGRFPHRNEILGRDSTPEEIEFLRQPGSSF